jgi:hypothetical protein
MMSAIYDPPNTYNFGLEFNYALWTEQTRVTMVNVSWNNDYRDIVKFADKTALNNYIDSIEGSGVVIDNLSYVKPNQPIRISLPFNAAFKYNYLRASNPVQPIDGDVQKDYYYFVTDVRYIAPNTTEIVVQLDVWQTFGFDATFGNCYIERGHIGIANTKAFDNYGRDYLTIPEGLDVGSEYQVVTRRSKAIMAYDLVETGPDFANAVNFDILVVSSVDLLADPGTVADPHLHTADGGKFFNLPSGATHYIFDGSTNSFPTFMQAMKDTPWITQGIISITAIPPISRYLSGWTYAPNGIPKPAPSDLPIPRMYSLFANWRNSSDITGFIPDRYKALKKLMTFPYMVIELTTYSGTPIIIKPESWADPDANVTERLSLAPPNQRVSISPYKYNAIAGTPTDNIVHGFSGVPDWNGKGDDAGDYIDFATYITNFPTFAIVNNGAISYLAANAHGIAFQNTSAGWQQQRALGSNEVSYDQASSGMKLANDLTGIGISADTARTDLSNQLMTQQAIVGGIGSVLGGVGGGAAGIAGGVGSAVMGGVNAAMTEMNNSQQLAVRNSAAGKSNRAQVGNQGYVRDTNKNLADWAARGDYQNTIAGINAKVQDAHLTQPTTSGQVGGEAMNIVNNNAVVSARFKMIDQANIRVVGEYWLRYGYAVRQFAQLPASMMVMSKFTYWKLTETYISSSRMPESFKQVIRGIFEKGVTVWASPDYIGVTDIADNTPLAGVTL